MTIGLLADILLGFNADLPGDEFIVGDDGSW